MHAYYRFFLVEVVVKDAENTVDKKLETTRRLDYLA